ncbi:MAG: restriction endonuclease [Verrucomicrobiae bacterium]|nr:restriction endonuclease [Verrucomicrobiae bacterium]
MPTTTPPSVREISKSYDTLVGNVDHDAKAKEDRAYGGVVRAAKGMLVESMGQHLVRIAWKELEGVPKRLSFERTAVRVPLRDLYLDRLEKTDPSVARYIRDHRKRYVYPLKTDIHVSVDGRFAMGVECKAYAENAMLKRILIDFWLLRHAHPDLTCVLLQLESQLTGDYSDLSKSLHLGSTTTHTLLSYFDYDLHILTLLEGERKVDRPIHKRQFYKPLKEEHLAAAVCVLKKLLLRFL